MMNSIPIASPNWTKCPHCRKSWPSNTAHAACIRLFAMCLPCREKELADAPGALLGMHEILEEKNRFNEEERNQ